MTCSTVAAALHSSQCPQALRHSRAHTPGARHPAIPMHTVGSNALCWGQPAVLVCSVLGRRCHPGKNLLILHLCRVLISFKALTWTIANTCLVNT